MYFSHIRQVDRNSLSSSNNLRTVTTNVSLAKSLNHICFTPGHYEWDLYFFATVPGLKLLSYNIPAIKVTCQNQKHLQVK